MRRSCIGVAPGLSGLSREGANHLDAHEGAVAAVQSVKLAESACPATCKVDLIVSSGGDLGGTRGEKRNVDDPDCGQFRRGPGHDRPHC